MCALQLTVGAATSVDIHLNPLNLAFQLLISLSVFILGARLLLAQELNPKPFFFGPHPPAFFLVYGDILSPHFFVQLRRHHSLVGVAVCKLVYLRLDVRNC